MANDVSGLNWVLDTASASTIWPDAWWANEIRWENYNNSSDTCVLTDAAGKTVFSGHGLASLDPIASTFGKPQRYFGLKMPTQSSGKIYIAIR